MQKHFFSCVGVDARVRALRYVPQPVFIYVYKYIDMRGFHGISLGSITMSERGRARVLTAIDEWLIVMVAIIAHRSCLGGRAGSAWSPSLRSPVNQRLQTLNLPPWKFKKRIIIKTKVCLIRHVYFADNLLGIKRGSLFFFFLKRGGECW